MSETLREAGTPVWFHVALTHAVRIPGWIHAGALLCPEEIHNENKESAWGETLRLRISNL